MKGEASALEVTGERAVPGLIAASCKLQAARSTRYARLIYDLICLQSRQMRS